MRSFGVWHDIKTCWPLGERWATEEGGGEVWSKHASGNQVWFTRYSSPYNSVLLRAWGTSLRGGLCLESSEYLWVRVKKKKKDLPWNKCTLHLFPPDWSRVHHLFIFFVLLTQHPGGRGQRYYLFHQELSTRQCYILNNEQSAHFVLFFNLSVLPVYRL